jgi:putative radical SAM enzyme (TIGR03279 family)
MTVRIARVAGTSSFFEPGDEIVAIDSLSAEDQLDVLFHTAGSGSARFMTRRGARTRSRVLTLAEFARARLVFDGMRFLRCRSNCIFCFMDQMPRGMRASLYEKDDDYRLSFLFGNFITLNDVSDRDISRIIKLGLSPLFVSVHVVSPAVRERIFARTMRRDIMEDLSRLARAGIVLHTQIVLVPGVNDGAALRDTVRKLFGLYPACRSVAIVPVGLTKHRRGLPRLRGVTVSEARALITWAARENERLAGTTGGDTFIQLADEFFLATNRALPPAETYGDFPQLSNGVGLCRHFLAALEKDITRLSRRSTASVNLTIATGTIGARFMRRYVMPLVERRLPRVRFRILVVRNAVFGPEVGVSGLLSGRDILRAARGACPISGCLVIPANAVNHEGVFLDDLRPADLERELGVPVIAARSTFLESRVLRRCNER